MLETLIAGIVIFTLATFLGVELINRVPTTLHTPLMSGANAVSGITVVGAMIVAGSGHGWISSVRKARLRMLRMSSSLLAGRSHRRPRSSLRARF